MNLEISKNNTVFCDKLPNLKMNDLLNEIFKRLSTFNRINNYCPDNITLNHNDYLRIKEERPELILTRDEQDYILCMRITY